MARIGLFDVPLLMRGLGNLAVFVWEMFPPNLAIIPTAAAALLETVEMALVGTFLGFLVALPFGLLGARNVFSEPIIGFARAVLAVARTIPSLLWALIFVVAVGLGPLAGTLGLAAYTVGYLGKLYYEAVEAVDPDVLEAVKSVGCSKVQLIRFAVIPESANQILSQLMFMFEYNVRASSILGFVGAGGVGFYMLGYVQVFDYRSLMTVLIATLALVVLMDWVSAKLRQRFVIIARR